jgi:radical SAM superfamily enzyme YgiQ (UPF0313 family)
VTDTNPINIGFLGSYAKSLYGDNIEVSLFKYPQSVVDAVKADPPDVLALSNYCWNSYLTERLAQIAKEANPDVITVQGGTNFPNQPDQCRDFLLRRPDTDIYVELEGETGFINLIGRMLESGGAGNDASGVFEGAIDGCQFIAPSTRSSSDPKLIKGMMPPRISDLDVIPSPYLNGMLDPFFDGRLTPFLETNRGCPFHCSFCHTGNDYFQKTHMFSIERIRAEIAYIAPRAAELGIMNLHLADTNFGMYPRDREICIALSEAKEKYGWPVNINATTGKNNKERVIEATRIMGSAFAVTMSVQSMDEKVLNNINRDNIKLDAYMDINQHLAEQGRATKGELILGLPGETRESFLRGVGQIMDAGVSSIVLYSLMLLDGTEFQDPKYREKHGIVGKYRIVPLDFGEYDGVRIFDYEEVGIQTNDMSFEDYLYLRGFALLVETLHNGSTFNEFFRTANYFGVGRTELLQRVYDRMDQAPAEIQELMRGYQEETRNELWDSAEELVAHYKKDENYQRLLSGEAGGNLIYKYSAMGLTFTAESWIVFLGDMCKEIVTEKLAGSNDVEIATSQLNVLSEFRRNKLIGLLDVTGNTDPVYMESQYDIVNWIQSSILTPLADYASVSPIRYEFFYSDEQMKVRADLFNRYGTDTNALSKIFGRANSLETMVRMVRNV